MCSGMRVVYPYISPHTVTYFKSYGSFKDGVVGQRQWFDNRPEDAQKWNALPTAGPIGIELLARDIKSQKGKGKKNKAGYTALGAPKHLYKKRRYGTTDGRTYGPTEWPSPDQQTDRPPYTYSSVLRILYLYSESSTLIILTRTTLFFLKELFL